MSSNKQHRQVKNAQKQQSASEATSFERLVNKTDRPKTQEAEGKDLAEKRERRAKSLKQAKKMAGAAISTSIKGVDIASDTAYNTIKQLEATKNPVEQTSEADGAGSVSQAYIDVAHGSKKAFKNALEQASKNKDAAKKASQNLEKVKAENKKIEKVARQKRVTKKAARAQILENSYKTKLGTGNALGRLSSRIVGTLNHATAKPRAVIGATKKVTGGIKAAIAGIMSFVLMAPLSILMIAVVLTGIFGASSGNGLEGDQLAVYLYLKGQDFTDEAAAAVMGNIEQESSWNPDAVDGTGLGDSLGYWQITNDEKYCFISWCLTKNIDKLQLTSQLEWTFSGEEGTLEYGYWANRWQHTASDEVINPYYYQGVASWEERFATSYYANPDDFKNSTDVELATYSWMSCYERCEGYKNNYDYARLDTRINAAKSFLKQIRSAKTTSGYGQEFSASSAQQQAIVKATEQVPTPGGGLCAMWVSQVYQAAGFGYPGGNANDMYWSYCTSSDRSELKVGMIIAVPSHNGTEAGKTYGHVGIYIGNNQVRHNTGTIETVDLDEWIDGYGDLYTPKWGFAASVSAN